MEVGLRAMAKAIIPVPAPHPNWAQMIEQLEKEVRNLSAKQPTPADWKEQQEYYAGATSHFYSVKDAWRNHTMHATLYHMPEEAQDILISVRGFMQELAERLSE